jgi:ATP-binding protein involved in chromosome partitioning
MPADRRGGGAATSPPSQDAFLAALRGVVDPELGEDIVTLGMVRSVACQEGRVRVEIALTVAGCPLRTQLRDDVTRRLGALAGVEEVEVATAVMGPDERARLMSTARRAAQSRAVTTSFPEATRVLAVVSGKGGVGKSSVTVNLALALSRRGCAVGLLDADIWGFSIPRLLGIAGPLEVRAGKIQPARIAVGTTTLRVVSMGFLADEDEAIMWRGLVLARAVQHFLEDVAWGPLDYLLVDMPPGTGDVQMALARMLPRAEFLVVSTPSAAAAKVAGRAADMARKGHGRVAGVIENMAPYTTEDGRRHTPFGEGGGASLAAEIGAPLLGSLPFAPELGRAGDTGTCAELDRASALGRQFTALAARIATQVAPLIEMSGCTARLVDHVEKALARPAS